MTINSEVRTAGPYTGSGGTGPFSFAFEVFATSELLVQTKKISDGTIATLALTTDYTVSLNANQNASPGGTITLIASLSSAYTLTMTSAVQFKQATQLTNNGPFFAKTITTCLDRLTILAQQVKVTASRAIKFPIVDGTSLTTDIPAAAQRASKALIFDGSGNVTVSVDNYNDQLVNVTAQATAAAASAAAAALDKTACDADVVLTHADVVTTGTNATTSTTQAGIATTQAGIATTQAGTATTQAGTATTQAGIATAKAVLTAADRVQTGLDVTTTGTNATTSTTQAGTATTQATNAASSATLSSQWASQTSAIVAATDYSAKEFAIGSQAATGGSAKNWAKQTGADVTGASTNDRSAKSWAQEDLHGATLGGSSKDWAQSASLPDGTSKSSKSYAADAAASAVSAATIAAGVTDTSTTSLAIGTGAKTFTVSAGKQFAANQFFSAGSAANAANYMHGTVTSYSGTTLITNVTDIGGSGTKADWNISISGSQGAPGATGAAGSIPIAAAAGTVDAITATPSGVTLADQTLCAIVSAGANTSTTPTFAPNSLTAHTITTRGGAALVAGDIGAAGYVALLEYNLANTRWELLNPAKVISGDVSGAISETKGGTNQTSYAAGDILYASATNVLSKLAKGSDTNVLTLASGLPSWAAPAGSSQVVLLATATASTSSTLDFISKISSSYSSYIVVFNSLLPTTSSGTLQLYVSGDNGSTWTPTLDGQLWSISLASTTAPTYTNNANGVSPADLTAGSLNTGRPLHGVFNFTTGSGANDGQFFWEGTMSTTGGTLYKTFIISGDTANVNAIRIAPSTSTLASGNVYLYGIKNT